ncbi:sulfatase family protein [Deinococcus sp. UYEF24]
MLGILAFPVLKSEIGAEAQTGSGSNGAKPNFIFVLTDDLSWNLVAHMPHVKALQQTGMTMSNYTVVDSLCCPSRTAIFTGTYPHNNGVFTNSGTDGGYAAYNRNGDEARTFALALQKVGYTTGFMGKYLNGYEVKDPVPPGWNEWDVAGSGGYKEFNYSLNENGTAKHYGGGAGDYMVDVLAGKAEAFVGAAASARQPFMLEVATFAPHAPYTPAPRYQGAAASIAYPTTPAYNMLPSNPPSYLKNRPPLTAKQQQRIRTDYDKRIEADMAVDDLVGRLQQALQARGVAQNTYFVFSSDNGYHMGEYRLMPGKQTAFDTDVHVPLIVSGPGIAAGTTSAELTSNIDLAPTFEALAGTATPASVDGLSLAGLWHGQRPTVWPQAVLIEHHGPNDLPDDPDAQTPAAANPPSYEALRTATGLYVRYENGEQEYYDTTRDPAELHNLAPGAGVSGTVPAALPGMLTALATCKGAAACLAASRF